MLYLSNELTYNDVMKYNLLVIENKEIINEENYYNNASKYKIAN